MSIGVPGMMGLQAAAPAAASGGILSALGGFLGPIGMVGSLFGALGGGQGDQKFIDQTMKPQVPQPPPQEEIPPEIMQLPPGYIAVAMQEYRQTGRLPEWVSMVTAQHPGIQTLRGIA